jgi:PAS domain S-box-containing protein
VKLGDQPAHVADEDETDSADRDDREPCVVTPLIVPDLGKRRQVARRIDAQVRAFTEHVQRMTERSRRFEGLTRAAAAPDPQLLRDVSDELHVRHEELTAAAEELEAQAEELLRTRVALENERLRYRDLFDAAPDPYFVTDSNGVIREANFAAGALLHVEPQFLVGKPLIHFVARGDTRAFRDAISTMSASPEKAKIEHLEVRLRPRDKAPVFYAWLTATPIFSRQRAPSFRWIARDMTAVHRRSEELEQRVATSSAELAREAMEKNELLAREKTAREEAERANATKDAFLATLATELRSPLHSILAWTRLLQRGNLDRAAAKGALEAIARSSSAQLRLVDECLEVSRIAAGKLALDMARVDLAAVIRRAIEASRPATDVKRLRVDCVIDDACTVDGDVHRLRQVLENLLENATEFTPIGGRIVVNLARIGSSACIRIEDSGAGASPDTSAHFFAETEREKLGLGLSIVRQLVELHGGSVRAENDGAGRGATLVVALPLAGIADGGRRPAPPALAGLKVLLVSKNVAQTEELARVLEGRAGQVSIRDDVESALIAVKEWGPDVVVVDVAIDDERGYAFLERAKELAGRRLRGIALTPFARPVDAERALSRGYHAYVARPLEAEAIVSAIGAAANGY